MRHAVPVRAREDVLARRYGGRRTERANTDVPCTSCALRSDQVGNVELAEGWPSGQRRHDGLEVKFAVFGFGQ
ncbi:hypothetical protein [Propionibacterium sp.]|uniref:hypothetical protein n=1 Tax=Propionibacterium sp. TaxID=1977903 RepID=UPI0039EACAF3